MERLPADELFVEYYLDARDLVVFTAWQGRLSTHRLRNAAPEVRSLAASVRFHMDTATWREGALSRSSENALSHRLGPTVCGWLRSVDRLKLLHDAPGPSPGRGLCDERPAPKPKGARPADRGGALSVPGLCSSCASFAPAALG